MRALPHRFTSKDGATFYPYSACAVNPLPGHLSQFENFKLPNLKDSMGFPWGT